MKIYKISVGGCVRYIGRTSKKLTARLQQHLGHARRGGRTHLQNWLRSLQVRPEIELIREVLGDGSAEEIYEIALAKDYGCRLVNTTPGGDGLGVGAEHPNFGTHHSPEHRAKIAAAGRGRKQTSETCEKLRIARLGKPLTPEHRKKLSEAKAGKTLSVDHREKIRQSHLGAKNHFFGKRHSFDARKKMSIAKRRWVF